MDHERWTRKWEAGQTPWHRTVVEPILEKYLDQLASGRSGVSIVVTMCGKTVDIPWLCEKGHSVTGVELSPTAVQQLFQENSIPYAMSESGDFTVYSATDRNIKIYCGDMFKFLPSVAGQFDAIWDCNALVAVNTEDRQQYVNLLPSLLKPGGKILMTTWEYDESLKKGQPFSINGEHVKRLFEPHCDTKHLDIMDGSALCKYFNLPWANRLVFLLTKHT